MGTSIGIYTYNNLIRPRRNRERQWRETRGLGCISRPMTCGPFSRYLLCVGAGIMHDFFLFLSFGARCVQGRISVSIPGNDFQVKEETRESLARGADSIEARN